MKRSSWYLSYRYFINTVNKLASQMRLHKKYKGKKMSHQVRYMFS